MQRADQGGADGGSKDGGRNLRSSALRFWAAVLQRFPEGLDFNCFWPRFLAAVEPQMERMPAEVHIPFQSSTASTVCLVLVLLQCMPHAWNVIDQI